MLGSSQQAKKQPKAIALRVTDEELMSKIEELAKDQGLSLNMTVNLLIGYAFNQVEKENKKFVSKNLLETA